MSDTSDQSNKPENQEGGETPPASIAGKGWDILVGGKQNPYAAGGSDPFDVSKTPAAGAQAGSFGKDAETDAILKAATAPVQPAGATMSDDAQSDKGRGAEMPRDLSPDELAKPGVSSGVTVTPVMPALSAAPTPSGSGITEVGKPTPSGAIVEIRQPAPPLPLPPLPAPPPASPAASPVKATMPAARPIPSASPAAPVPTVPGLSIPPRFGSATASSVSDPFSTQTDMVLQLDSADLPLDPALGTSLLTQDRIDALWNAINETYALVINDVRGHFNTTEEAIMELRQAREYLLSGLQNYDNAEELVMAVKARLRLEEKVRQWAETRGSWLATYLVMWLLLISFGLWFTNQFNQQAAKFMPEFLASAGLPTMFGILGGVIGALWVLNKHITRKRDFDPIHTMWYVTNPFLGGALGAATYVIMRGGGLLVAQTGGGTDFKMTPLVVGLLAALCLVVGFNQNVLWSLVDRFIKTIVPEQEGDNVAATDAGKSSTTTTSTSGGGSSTTSSSSSTSDPGPSGAGG
jgi:hypothetical protein